MREIAARAQAEKEAKAKEETERAGREQESKGAERAQVEQELAGAAGELERLGGQLAEAEALTEQMANVPAQARAEFDTELTALRQETETARARLAELTARKEALDGELSATAVTTTAAETPPATVPETNPAPAEVTEKTPEEIGREFSALSTVMMKEVQAINETPYDKIENAQQRLDQLKAQREMAIAKINEVMRSTLKAKGPDTADTISGQIVRFHLIRNADGAINTLAQKINGEKQPRPEKIELQTEYSDQETGEIIKWTRWRGEIAKARGETDSAAIAEIDARAFTDTFEGFSLANFSPEGVAKLKQRQGEVTKQVDQLWSPVKRNELNNAMTLPIKNAEYASQRRHK